MADHAENLITLINADGNFTGVHVGEVIPESEQAPWIWLRLSGERFRDCTQIPQPIESTFFDIEIVSGDIDQARSLTAKLKTKLAAVALWSADFESLVQAIDVTDHDDDYVVQTISADDDGRLHLGALAVEFHH